MLAVLSMSPTYNGDNNLFVLFLHFTKCAQNWETFRQTALKKVRFYATFLRELEA